MNSLPKGFSLIKTASPNKFTIFIDKKIFWNKEYVKQSVNQIENEKEWWMEIHYTTSDNLFAWNKEKLFQVLNDGMYIV